MCTITLADAKLSELGRVADWALPTAGALVAALGVRSLYVSGLLAGPRYRGPVSDHFDGHLFHNLEPSPAVGPPHPLPPSRHAAAGLTALRFLRWARRPWQRSPWPDWVPAEPGPPPPPEVRGADLRVTFINHSTVLVQTAGLNLLTDPIWSHRCSPVSFAGPARRRPPGIRFEDLPRIDAVLVSHNHYDHLDLPTLKRLARRDHPLILVTLGNKALLGRSRIGNVAEMDWWDRVGLGGGVEVHCVPARHFSARGLYDRNATLWGGYAIHGPAGTVYFGGDTGHGAHFEQIGREFGPIRLALLPIGAFLPRRVMANHHLSPQEAVCAQQALGAATSVPIHYGTFPLGADGQDEPVRELQRVLQHGAYRHLRFWVLDPGEGRVVPAV